MISTSIPIMFDNVQEANDSRFLKAKIWIMHTGQNLNNSIFTKEIISAAIPSLANIPVLGYIQVDKNNKTDFKGHEQRLVINENGIDIEYLGSAFGIVPETNNAQFETKLCSDNVEREFLTCDVLLHRKFSVAINIVERDGVKNHSMELHPPSIKGAFNKQKVFEFSDFKFEGLCLLADNVTPAMKDSILEKFSETSIQASFTHMLQEFNEYYSHQKGGKTLNEKEELFSKYPSLSEEDVQDIKANLEQFSLEELESKLNELVSKQSFSFTAAQLSQELRISLSSHKAVDKWGDETRAFWYIDHDENRVYAEDVMNSYRPVGLNYTVNGDLISIDFESKKRIKFVPQDMEDGTTSESFSFVSNERSTDIDSVKSQQIKDLETYKFNREKEDKLKLVESFSDLSDEETKSIVDNIDKLSSDEIETQLFAIVGKKNFSVSDRSKKHIIAGSGSFSPDLSVPAWAEEIKLKKQNMN